MAIHYKRFGESKNAVIVMHEFMGDHSNYEGIFPYLNDKDLQWIFTDFRGYGLSKQIKGEFSLEEASLDIIELMDELNLQTVFLLGHSMSSLIAQYLALKYPTRIKALILVTPIAPTGIQMKDEAKNRMLKSLKEQSGLLESVVESASKRYNKKWREKRIALAHNCSSLEAKEGYMRMYLENDFSEEVKGSNLPIYIITGKDDLPAFHKNSVKKSFMKYYTNLEFLECEMAGHYPMIETPVWFATRVEKILLSL